MLDQQGVNSVITFTTCVKNIIQMFVGCYSVLSVSSWRGGMRVEYSGNVWMFWPIILRPADDASFD